MLIKQYVKLMEVFDSLSSNKQKALLLFCLSANTFRLVILINSTHIEINDCIFFIITGA